MTDMRACHGAGIRMCADEDAQFRSRAAEEKYGKRSAGSALAPPGSGEQATGGVRSLVAPATCPTG